MRKYNSSNPIVQKALNARGVIDYSRFQPQDKWEVLDDLETISGTSPADVADLKKIKKYAQKFGVIAQFNRHCDELSVKV